MKQLTEDVIQWAREKGIFDKGTGIGQWKKMNEEVGEVIGAMCTEDFLPEEDFKEDLALEIGDVLVTAIVLAEMYNLDIEGCLAAAYQKISGRAGEMVNGQFVKAEPSLVSSGSSS